MLNRTRALVATLAATASLAACGGEKAEPNYAKDGDTGAAAPATQQTLSPNPAMGDTTQGARTQQPQMAGDSGAKGTVPTPIPGTPTSTPLPEPPAPGTKRP